jgi:hypothetical protein
MSTSSTAARFASAIVLALISGACGSSGSGATTGAPPAGTGTAAQSTCYDAQGNVTAACATTLTGTLCPAGDANACTPLVRTAIYADDGKNGVCVHLVFANECGSEIFAYTCIGLAPGAVPDQLEQCWMSSVDVGGTIDVSECHASGAYFSVATASSGQLGLLMQKCPAPPIDGSGQDGG